MHRAAKRRTDEHPEHAGQVTELRGKHGADQRTGSGNRGKMVTEDDPLVGFDEVTSVTVHLGRRRTQVVKREHLRHQPRGMETVADRENAKGRDHHPKGIDGFAAGEGEKGDRACPGECNEAPAERA